MDYGRMGAPKIKSNKPRHADRDGKGAPKDQAGQQAQKEALLQRMKAAARRQDSANKS